MTCDGGWLGPVLALLLLLGATGCGGPTPAFCPRLFFTATPGSSFGVRLDGTPPAGATLSCRPAGTGSAGSAGSTGSTTGWAVARAAAPGMWTVTGPAGGAFECRLEAPGLEPRLLRAATAPGPGTTVTFAVYGDSRTDHDAHRAVLAVLRARSPAFVVHVGDLVNGGNFGSAWDDYLPRLQPLASEAPFLLAMGNHEASRELYLSRFGTPDGNRWFTLDYGPVRLIVLSAEEAPAGAQAAFLRSALAGAPTGVRWTLVFFHRPFLTPVRDRAPSAQLRAAWGPMLEGRPRTLVLAGHDHLYARRVIDGTLHVTTGGGGAPLYTNLDPTGWDKVCATHHGCVVTADPNAVPPVLRFQALDTTGSVIDSFDVPAP